MDQIGGMDQIDTVGKQEEKSLQPQHHLKYAKTEFIVFTVSIFNMCWWKYSLVETWLIVHLPFVTCKHDLLSILQYMLRHSYSFSFQVAIAREYQIYLLSLHHTEIFVQPIKCRNRSINYVNRMVEFFMYFVYYRYLLFYLYEIKVLVVSRVL